MSSPAAGGATKPSRYRGWEKSRRSGNASSAPPGSTGKSSAARPSGSHTERNPSASGFLFSARVATYIRERVWHPSQRLRERRDGSLEMRLETSGHKELVRWVLWCLPDVEVLAPRSLRDRVREKLHEALG